MPGPNQYTNAWSDADHQALVHLRRKGYPNKTIAGMLGRSYRAIVSRVNILRIGFVQHARMRPLSMEKPPVSVPYVRCLEGSVFLRPYRSGKFRMVKQ